MANIKISELNPLLTVQDADVLPIVDNGVTKKVTAAILQSYTQGNSVLLTGAQTVAGIKTFTSQLASTVATGTAPFSVASTTKVTNLNADLLDGLSSADFQAPLSGTGIVKSTAGTISYLTDNSTNWNTAYNDKINSAAVTGSGTNTLTLTQQDAGTITATWVNGTLIREVRNSTGATLTKGTIVYISGATGNKPTVSKAIATGDSTSAQTFGFIQTDILNNANGYVVVVGDLTGLDTSAFAEGAQLYLSSTTAGTFTDVKQYAPNHLVYVGIVTRAHPTLGQIEVNIQNGYELDELHNVAAQSPSNGDILQYVTSTGLWTKIGGTTSAISEGSNLYFTNARSRTAISLTTTGTSGAATYNSTTGVLNVPNYADTDTGITSLNGLTALTQTFAVGTSGTDFGISSATSTHTFNLPTASATNRGALSSADWTTFNNKTSNLGTVTSVGLTSATSGVTIGASPVTTSGDITLAIATASGSLNGLLSSTDWTTFNNKQNALTNPITGTGTTNYLPKFTGASALGNSIFSDNGSIGYVSGNLQVENTTSTITLASTFAGAFQGIEFRQLGSLDATIQQNPATGEFRISNGRSVGWGGIQTFYTDTVERMRITDLGNILINTTTNAGYKLDVNGTARVSGNVTISAGNEVRYYRADNAIYTRLYDVGGSSGFVLNNMNSDGFSFQNEGVTKLRIATTGAATFSSSVTSISNTNGQIAISPASNISAAAFTASNAGGSCYFGKNNSTGGAFTGTAYATVVYSGGDVPMAFYTNDTERMRIKSSGVINIASIPTSSAGLSAGDIWSDGGTLKIV